MSSRCSGAGRSLNRGSPAPSAAGWTMSRYSSTTPSRDSAWSKLAPGDSRLGPVGAFQRLREDDLGDLVHRPREVAIRGRPVSGHLLVGDPAHQVRAGTPARVEDPALGALVGVRVTPRM